MAATDLLDDDAAADGEDLAHNELREDAALCAVCANPIALAAWFLKTKGCNPKYYHSLELVSLRIRQIRISMRTGVSKAMQATILGQRGAFVSGREVTMPMRASAATRPPILYQIISQSRKIIRSQEQYSPMATQHDLCFPRSPSRAACYLPLDGEGCQPVGESLDGGILKVKS